MNPHIFVIDDDHAIRWVLQKAFEREKFTVTTFASAAGVLESLQRRTPDAIVADIRMPGMSGLELLAHIQAQAPHIPVIIMTAHSDLDSAVSAYQGGAFDYLPKPFDVDEAIALVRRACQQRFPARTATTTERFPEIVGESPAMQDVFRAIGRLSHSTITVLITGESGTGKELVAQALHRHSPRADKPLIAINTAAIPRDLLESELFGHERGAFTGAQSQRQGRFEQAHGGTLFLDEIGDMPPELQTRLLRVLAEGEFYRVGAHVPTRVDVRVIAATHQVLEQRVQQGFFREDLFHRLNVIRIHLPPLRRRCEDIPLLTRRFLGHIAKTLGVPPKQLRPDTERYLAQLDWPGNIRQLENVCRWLTVMAAGREVHIDDLPPELRERTATNESIPEWEVALRNWATTALEHGEIAVLNRLLPRFEAVLIQVALEKTKGHRQEAAHLLGWGRNTLTRKIKELSIAHLVSSEVSATLERDIQ